jgi:hypothetical protein
MLHLSSEFLSNDIVLWGSLELCHCFLTARRVTAIMRALRHPRHAAPKVNAAGRLYAAPNVGFWANSGQSWILASSGYDANDPSRTLPARVTNLA